MHITCLQSLCVASQEASCNEGSNDASLALTSSRRAPCLRAKKGAKEFPRFLQLPPMTPRSSDEGHQQGLLVQVPSPPFSLCSLPTMAGFSLQACNGVAAKFKAQSGTTSEAARATIEDMNKHITLDPSKKMAYFEGKKIRTPMVVDAKTLNEPMRWRNRSGQVVFSVLPLAESRRRLKRAVTSERLDDFCAAVIMHRRKQEAKEAQGDERYNLMSLYGDTDSTSIGSGMFIHGIVTEEEDDAGRAESFKLLYPHQTMKGGKTPITQACRDVVKDIGSVLEELYETKVLQSTDEDRLLLKMQKKRVGRWYKDQADMLKTDPSVPMVRPKTVGCSHSTGAAAAQNNTGQHRDDTNATAEWGGVPDYHASLKNKRRTAFLIYLLVGPDCVLPVLVVQRKYTAIYFYGGNLSHGAVDVATYLDNLRPYCGGPEFDDDGDFEEPEDEDRVWISYYTKSMLPGASLTKQQYEMLHKTPRLFTIVPDVGSGQTEEDRKRNKLVISKKQQCRNYITTLTTMKIMQSSKDCGIVTRQSSLE